MSCDNQRFRHSEVVETTRKTQNYTKNVKRTSNQSAKPTRGLSDDDGIGNNSNSARCTCRSRAFSSFVHLFAVLCETKGSLRSYDSCCNENVTLKYNCVKFSVLWLFQVDHIQNRRIALSLPWREWFSCKEKELKIYCYGLALSSQPQKWKFDVFVWQTTLKNCTEKRAARAARLFFLIQTTNDWFVALSLSSLFLKLPKDIK